MGNGIDGYVFSVDNYFYFLPAKAPAADIADAIRLPDGRYVFGWKMSRDGIYLFMPLFVEDVVYDRYLSELIVANATYLLN